METTEELRKLADFRAELYQRGLGHRKDSMFELLDAVLVAERPQTLVRLSLEPVFRRQWSSAPDALADGQLHVEVVRVLVQEQLSAAIATPVAGRPVWAVDLTVWPRPAALTSPERTFGHRPTPGIPESGVVPGWEYQWLVEVPEARGSWVRPLDVVRRRPTSGTPTQLAIDQVRTALQSQPAGVPRPVVTFDSGYDPVELAKAVQHPDPAQRLECAVIVRLPLRRRFFRAPPPYSGRGAPRKHGNVFHLKKPATQGPPDCTVTATDPEHGQVQVDVWENLHDQSAAATPLTIVRVQVERLPHSGRKPKPLWLAWIARARPASWLDVWHFYQRRFASEHGFRFLKHDLGWTTVRPRSPEAADRWSWLLVVALWQLWLARALVADQRLPWERPLPPERLTPGRIRRTFVHLLPALGTPTASVRPRGKAPGRQPGACPGPRPRYPVVYRRPKPAVTQSKTRRRRPQRAA